MSALAELQRIAERDGAISPETVLDEARPPTAPLHRHFEWDDGAAAEAYRLDQAARLIRRYAVEIHTEPEKTVRARAFVSIGSRQYAPIDKALNDPKQRGVVLEQCIRELAAVRRKYEHLVDFDAAIQAVAAQRPARRRRGTA